VKPDSDWVVAISTRSGVVEMIAPGSYAVLCPLFIGLTIGPKCLMGLLAGAIASGCMVAIMMSSAGGAWDNSKKLCEKLKIKKTDLGKASFVGILRWRTRVTRMWLRVCWCCGAISLLSALKTTWIGCEGSSRGNSSIGFCSLWHSGGWVFFHQQLMLGEIESNGGRENIRVYLYALGIRAMVRGLGWARCLGV